MDQSLQSKIALAMVQHYLAREVVPAGPENKILVGTVAHEAGVSNEEAVEFLEEMQAAQRLSVHS